MLHAECPLPGVLPSLVFAVEARIGFPAHPSWLGREWFIHIRGTAQAFVCPARDCRTAYRLAHTVIDILRRSTCDTGSIGHHKAHGSGACMTGTRTTYADRRNS